MKHTITNKSENSKCLQHNIHKCRWLDTSPHVKYKYSNLTIQKTYLKNLLTL